jgi:hypothetical protein
MWGKPPQIIQNWEKNYISEDLLAVISPKSNPTTY